MSKNSDSVTLVIMGKEYKMSCDPEEQDDLIEAARDLDNSLRKIRDSGKINGAERIAVVVAINLAYELRVARQENAELNRTVAKQLSELRGRIDQTLNDSAYHTRRYEDDEDSE